MRPCVCIPSTHVKKLGTAVYMPVIPAFCRAETIGLLGLLAASSAAGFVRDPISRY